MIIEMESDKKKRGANFSNSERQNLMRITNKYKHILENKKTDAVTWRQKEETWKKIENIWNSSTTGLARTAKQLKDKYNSIKKEIKKRYSNHGSYVTGTGGGKYIPPPEPPTEEEKELEKTIVLSVQGLNSTFDSDAIAGISGVQFEDISIENSDVEDIETNWSHYTPKMYQTPVHPSLSEPGPSTIQDGSPYLQEDVNNVNNENIDITNIVVDHHYTSHIPQSDKERVGKRRPVLKKKKSMSSAAAKFEALAEKKIELIELEKNVAEEKQQQNQIKHEKKLAILNLEKIEYELKIELLKHKIEKTKSRNEFEESD